MYAHLTCKFIATNSSQPTLTQKQTNGTYKNTANKTKTFHSPFAGKFERNVATSYFNAEFLIKYYDICTIWYRCVLSSHKIDCNSFEIDGSLSHRPFRLNERNTIFFVQRRHNNFKPD